MTYRVRTCPEDPRTDGDCRQIQVRDKIETCDGGDYALWTFSLPL